MPAYELESTHYTRPNLRYSSIISYFSYDTIVEHTYAGVESLTCAERRRLLMWHICLIFVIVPNKHVKKLIKWFFKNWFD